MIRLVRGPSPRAEGAPADAVVVTLDQPWDAPLPELPRGAHVLVTAFVGLKHGVWRDGPLLHRAPDGRVLSLVPRGGDGELTLPGWQVEPSPSEAGDFADADTDDSLDPLPERAVRCGMARLLATARDLSPALAFRAGRLDARAAVVTTLLRKAFPARPILLAGPTAPSLAPPAFRRFCQNAGITLVDGASRAHAASDRWPWLEDLRDAAPVAHLPDLIAALNARSDVMPRGLQRL